MEDLTAESKDELFDFSKAANNLANMLDEHLTSFERKTRVETVHRSLNDAEEQLNKIIKEWEEKGFNLHKAVPQHDEGEIIGYDLFFKERDV